MFTQGVIVNTLTLYLDEMNLSDGLPYPLLAHYDDSYSNSDSDLPTKPSPSRFSWLKGSVRTSSQHRSDTSSSMEEEEVREAYQLS